MASSRRSRSKTDVNMKSTLRQRLEIPEMLDYKMPHIQADGNREIIVDGCKGIVEYSQDRIKLNTGALVIGFTGDGIEIKDYSDSQTVISGNIFSIDFESMG